MLKFRREDAPNAPFARVQGEARVPASSLNTFDANIKVKGGDLVGFWAPPGTICATATGSPADTASIFFPSGIPDAGETVTLQPGYAVGYRLNMQVTLKRGSGSGSSGSSGSSGPAAPVSEPQPARIAICTAQPILRADGTTGTFADVLANQYPTSDMASPYFGAVPAKYAQGIGLTCDNLPGFTDAGYKVNGDGARAPAGQEATWPAPYEYYTKNV